MFCDTKLILTRLRTNFARCKHIRPPQSVPCEGILWNIFAWPANPEPLFRKLHSSPPDICFAAEQVDGARSAASTIPSACTGTPRWPARPPSVSSPVTLATRALSAGECCSFPVFNLPEPIIYDHHNGQLSPAGNNDNHPAKWWESEWSQHFSRGIGIARAPSTRSQWSTRTAVLRIFAA